MIAIFTSLIPGLIAIFPIFGSRFIPTHDGEYHIIRFWQFYTSLASGNWFPRWASDLNHGYGIPLFTFQYPFPNYVGSMFHFFGLSFVDSVKWTLGIGYLLALLFCFQWIRRLFGKNPAIIATIVCAYIPYWFVDVYIRGSVGEVWALSWVFASLYAIASRRRLLLVITTALLIVSHNIMALICTPILFLYAYTICPKMISDIFVGLGVASYFWIPALYEQRFIQGMSSVNIFDYFPRIDQLLIPSWGSGFRGQTMGGTEMSYQIGLIPLCLGCVSIVLLLKRKCTKRKEFVFGIVCFWLAVFFMTTWSIPFWRVIPLVHFIQYPWRLLSIIVVMTPVLAGYIASQFRFGWVIACIAILITFGYSRPVTYEPRTDDHYLRQASFTKGTNSMGNAFQTKWFTGKQFESQDFLFSSGTVSANRLNPTLYHVSLSSSVGGMLTTPIAYYPGWIMNIEKKNIYGLADTDGLLIFDIPSGQYEAILRLGLTSWQGIAISISILSLSVAVGSFILRKYYAYRH